MATYVITDDVHTTWDDYHKYKYRFTSREGSPVAQDEVNRRRAAGRSVVLWRWENGEPTLVETHNG